MEKNRMIYLLTGAKNNTLTSAETDELNRFLSDPANRESFTAAIAQLFDAATELPQFHDELLPILEKTLAIDRPKQQVEIVSTETPLQRIHFFKTKWMRYAAAVVIIGGIGTYFWKKQPDKKPEIVKVNPAPVQNDIAPGGNKAVLTLADGRKIILDGTANGELGNQGSSRITKKGNQLIYNSSAGSRLPSEITYNTMSTPNSGQYQLVLPDGSKVWLNAASSITYPTAFSGSERKVTIKGEVYFEVAKNAKMPFVVTARSETITVLGTHFNVHAYDDDGPVKTSLLEGSVRISGKVLKPGEAYRNGKVMITDLDQDVAWKNGLFNFNNVDLPAAMHQLARWYDLEVQFEGNVPDKVIRGEMGRDLNLSQVLKILNKMEVKFRLEGKKLIVSP